MESVEKSDKIFGASNVLEDDDAVEQARADLAKATSPETIRYCHLPDISPFPVPHSRLCVHLQLHGVTSFSHSLFPHSLSLSLDFILVTLLTFSLITAFALVVTLPLSSLSHFCCELVYFS